MGYMPISALTLAIAGTTRRNRPNLHAGDVVYAKVTSAPRDAETEITCVLATGKVRHVVSTPQPACKAMISQPSALEQSQPSSPMYRRQYADLLEAVAVRMF